VPKIIRALSATLAVLVVGFTVGACGGSSSSSSPPSGSSSSSKSTPSTSASSGSSKLITKDPANADGGTITVGSKNFAEQYILGNIYAQALKAAGFKVKTQLDLGSEQIAYKTLRKGKISAYPEYSGTALSGFYNVTTDNIPRDPQASYDLLKKDAAKDGITALPQTPFQNTYVITSTKAEAKKLGNPTTVSGLAKAAGSKVSISGFPECRQRTDCLLGLKNKYHWTPKFVSSQGQYSDLDQGQADLTFGFGTDGALTENKYATYSDDKNLFPPYYISFLVNKQGMKALGAAGQAVIAKIQQPLTIKVMQELNSRVSIDKQKPADVAHQYLKAAGFIK
jgi:glycine betaine/choline ABC-type transport system substrate-binding protein